MKKYENKNIWEVAGERSLTVTKATRQTNERFVGFSRTVNNDVGSTNMSKCNLRKRNELKDILPSTTIRLPSFKESDLIACDEHVFKQNLTHISNEHREFRHRLLISDSTHNKTSIVPPC